MKQLRQRAIRDLVEQRPIRTQQELAAALRDRGFRATQATISRDIAELELVKVGREGVAVYALPARLAEPDPTGEERLRRLFRDIPVEFREAGPILSSSRCPGRRTRSRLRSTAPAGRKQSARSPATTHSSLRAQTGAPSRGSAAGLSAWRRDSRVV